MMQANLIDIRQKWSSAKPTKTITFWIAIGAIVLTMVLGFTRGGWTTDTTAMKMAETSAQGAVIDRLVTICVAQFNADPERALKLEELKAVSTFQRATYVKEQGWAMMPGETAPESRVVSECAKQLVLISEWVP